MSMSQEKCEKVVAEELALLRAMLQALQTLQSEMTVIRKALIGGS